MAWPQGRLAPPGSWHQQWILGHGQQCRRWSGSGHRGELSQTGPSHCPWKRNSSRFLGNSFLDMLHSHWSPGSPTSGSLPWSSHQPRRTGRCRAWGSPWPPCKPPGGGRQPLRRGRDTGRPETTERDILCEAELIKWFILFFTLYMFIVKFVGNWCSQIGFSQFYTISRKHLAVSEFCCQLISDGCCRSGCWLQSAVSVALLHAGARTQGHHGAN